MTSTLIRYEKIELLDMLNNFTYQTNNIDQNNYVVILFLYAVFI